MMLDYHRNRQGLHRFRQMLVPWNRKRIYGSDDLRSLLPPQSSLQILKKILQTLDSH